MALVASDLDSTDTSIWELQELGSNPHGFVDLDIEPYGYVDLIANSPHWIPGKTEWEEGFWKVRLSVWSLTSDLSADDISAQVFVYRCTTPGAIRQVFTLSPDPLSSVIPQKQYTFTGFLHWSETDAITPPFESTDRIGITWRFTEGSGNSGTIRLFLGSWNYFGVDKPIEVPTTVSTSASTTPTAMES